MNPAQSLPPVDANEEVFALIETLRKAGQRLEVLTAGEADTVPDRDGRTFLLQGAQDRLRHIDAARQAAILNALPAHIALLDTQGLIISVNEAWRQFAGANVIQRPGYGIGLNYLEICDSARKDGSSEAHQAAEGIRSVLDGRVKSFSIEYPCHSPTERRWFLMTVTPLADEHPNGAVVMHLDITERKQAQAALAQSEDGLHRAQLMAKLAHVITGPDGSFERWSETLPGLVGVEPAQLPRTTRAWLELLHPDDRSRFREKATEASVRNVRVELEYRLQRADGEWINVRQTMEPLKTVAMSGLRRFSTLQDITVERRTEESLRASESQFRQIADNISDVFFLVDAGTNRTLYLSPAFEEIWGRTREGAYADTDAWTAAVHPDDRASTCEKLKKGMSAGKVEYEYRIVRPDGAIRWIELRGFPVRDDAGKIVRLTGVAKDITEQKRAETRIKRLNRVQAVLSGINTLIVRVRDRGELFREACRIAVQSGQFPLAFVAVADPRDQLLKAVAWAGDERGFVHLTRPTVDAKGQGTAGLGAQAMQKRIAVVCNDIEADGSATRYAKEALERGYRSAAALPLVVDGTSIGALVLYAAEAGFFDDEEMRLLGELAGDISLAIDHIEKQERLDYLAYYDVLTGLANRSLFLERVAQYMRGAAADGHKLALFLVDLERFKNINDSLGRPAGDGLLKQVAEFLTRNVGDANLVARVGADHFAIVLPKVKQEGNVARLLEKAMEAFQNHPFRLNDSVFRVTLKAGVALFPEDGGDADTLLKNVEVALKKAKASGERYLFYTQNMTDTAAGKLTLENQLRQALEKEQFVLHYQPKVSLASGKLTSAEALIRWNDPQTGLVPPGRFILVLEETGLINDVGRWALRKAIADYLRWRAAGLPAVRIAVNVSPLQLRNRGFVAEIGEVVGIDSQAAAGLELEITESLLMEDVKHNTASLKAIRDLGVSIAIDDFGTGFSSLSYLSKLPVDTLKIDRSFVIEMTAGPQGLALVSTIITLAHSLKLKVVAEGVETEEQSRLLRRLGCDEMQGYLFSKPVPAQTFETKFLAA